MAGRRLIANAHHTTDNRLFPAIDRLFLAFVGLELVAFLVLPAGPLLVAAVAEASALRGSRSRRAGLWTLGAVLTVLVLLPYLLGLFSLNTIDEGPIHLAR